MWAGIAAGFVAVLSFWIFHTIWISNVPAVLLEGILWAFAAGSAIGWAFHLLSLHGGFSTEWRGGLLFGVAMWLLLAPNEILGLAFGPFTHLTRPVEFAAIAPAGLLSAPFAALLGWALTRQARATWVLVLAATLAHFMIGGSIVYFGGRGIILALFLLMLPTYLLAGFVLVRVRAAILARAGGPARAQPRGAVLRSDAIFQEEVRP